MSEAVGRTISIPAYDVSSYVVVTVSIAAGTPAEKVSLDWEEMIWKALELWHKTDKSICLLQPKDVHDGKQLYSRADKPEMFHEWDNYFHHKQRKNLSKATPKDNPRRIISTCLIGFRNNPSDFIERTRVDVARIKGKGCSISLHRRKPDVAERPNRSGHDVLCN